MKINNHSEGFTLIEVLVALFIAALALAGLLTQMARYADSTAYLRDKTIAHWVALNQLELERLANQHSNSLLADEKSGSAEMAGREWFWRVTPKKTAAEGFAQLDVTVYAEEKDKDPLTRIAGHVDRYHGL